MSLSKNSGKRQLVFPLLVFKIFIVCAILALAIYVIARLLRQYTYEEILRAITGIERRQLIIALALSVINYFVLSFYDAIGLHYVKRNLSYVRVLFVSLIGHSFSNNMGFALLSGGAVRYRFYSYWGLTAGDVSKMVAFTGFHYWSCLFLLGGFAFYFEPEIVTTHLKIPEYSVYLFGLVIQLPTIAYLIWTWRGRQPALVKSWNLLLPSFQTASLALIVAAIDWMLAAFILYSLFPNLPELHYGTILAAYFIAQVLAVLSHIPGGLGVFEAVVLYSFQTVGLTEIFGALIIYRLIYYILPFLVSAALFVLFELTRRKKRPKLIP
ncbi:MAG TPA: lysylphosphatidylglycerol synthase domain-containing protein [Oligoflexia bacterium]|nr:lysylphosphatidylglycerol synthase domain-containing protein [Oligoflexia bacterium]HMP27751.1 lysylphosphatidylglycerol synthase domain-containing protein [Oligoflexia bacterium]